MKISKIFFILFLFPTLLLSQNQISGTIVDEDDEPIPADVYIPELSIGTVANLDGEFFLNNIPNGRHEVIFSFLGLDRKSTRLNSSHVAISYAVFCLKKKKTTSHASIKIE